MSNHETQTEPAGGASALTDGLERMRCALRQIAEMPGHAGNSMRQLAGDAIGLEPLGDRECHGCINGEGSHSTSCTKHSDKTPSMLKGKQWEWNEKHGKWMRSNDSFTGSDAAGGRSGGSDS